MAAGDLISADYQAELRTTLMGPGTNFNITSIDVPPAPIITNDLPKLLADGKFQGSHFKSSIVVTLVMNVSGSTMANLRANLDTLETAWAIATSDITFVLRLPQWGKRSLSGRPINFDPGPLTPEQVPGRTIRGVRAQFEAGTPTWTQL